MIRLIGTRWKRSNAWSQGVLIGRISCKECWTSLYDFVSVKFVKMSESPWRFSLEYASLISCEVVLNLFRITSHGVRSSKNQLLMLVL